MSDYMNNGAPGNIVTQQGFVVSDAIRPEYTDEELKNEQAMMDKLTEERNEQYNEFVKDITPTHSLIRQMVHAFIVGGIVCVIGQAIINAGIAMGLDDKTFPPKYVLGAISREKDNMVSGEQVKLTPEDAAAFMKATLDAGNAAVILEK